MSTASPPPVAATVSAKKVAGHLQFREDRVTVTSYPQRFRADSVWQLTSRQLNNDSHTLSMVSSELDFGRLLRLAGHPDQAQAIGQSHYLRSMVADFVNGLLHEVEVITLTSAPTEATWYEVDLGNGESCVIGFLEQHLPKS